MVANFKFGDKVAYITDLNKDESHTVYTIQEVLPCVNSEQEYLIKGEYGNVKRAFESNLVLLTQNFRDGQKVEITPSSKFGAPFDEDVNLTLKTGGTGKLLLEPPLPYGEKVNAEFVKHDKDKPAAHLLPPIALLEVSKVLAFGARKYKEHGWRTVDKRSRYAAAVQRHLLAYQSGEDLDPESGLPHLAHLACSALFLLESQVLGLGEDDRHGKRNI